MCRIKSAIEKIKKDFDNNSTAPSSSTTTQLHSLPMKPDGDHPSTPIPSIHDPSLLIAWQKSRVPLASAFVRIANILAHRSTLPLSAFGAAPGKIANTKSGAKRCTVHFRDGIITIQMTVRPYDRVIRSNSFIITASPVAI